MYDSGDVHELSWYLGGMQTALEDDLRTMRKEMPEDDEKIIKHMKTMRLLEEAEELIDDALCLLPPLEFQDGCQYIITPSDHD